MIETKTNQFVYNIMYLFKIVLYAYRDWTKTNYQLIIIVTAIAI